MTLAAFLTTLAAYLTALAAYLTALAAFLIALAAFLTALAAYLTALAAYLTALAAYLIALAALETALADDSISFLSVLTDFVNCNNCLFLECRGRFQTVPTKCWAGRAGLEHATTFFYNIYLGSIRLHNVEFEYEPKAFCFFTRILFIRNISLQFGIPIFDLYNLTFYFFC